MPPPPPLPLPEPPPPVPPPPPPPPPPPLGAFGQLLEGGGGLRINARRRPPPWSVVKLSFPSSGTKSCQIPPCQPNDQHATMLLLLRYHLMHDSTSVARRSAQGRSEQCQPGSETTVYTAPAMDYERITETVDQASFTHENLVLQEGETTRVCFIPFIARIRCWLC